MDNWHQHVRQLISDRRGDEQLLHEITQIIIDMEEIEMIPEPIAHDLLNFIRYVLQQDDQQHRN